VRKISLTMPTRPYSHGQLFCLIQIWLSQINATLTP
jgi:hypothetical protein